MTGGAFSHLRIVDLSAVVVGPLATQFFADFGADVIKVEQAEGDLLRTLGGASRTGQMAPKFLHFNRGKRSIVLDLKQPEAIAALHRLLETADACITNMRPAALKRLGLSAEELRKRHPRLVCCSLVGFGSGGRYAGRPAYDGIIQGVGGVAATFHASTGEPRYVPMTIADHIVGIIASKMILQAIYHRDRTGEGQTIEVPMFENMAAFVLSEHMGQRSFEPRRGAMGDQRLLDPAAGPIATADGFISVSANTDKQAFALFDAIGRPELKTDPRFSSVAARYKNVEAYFAVRGEGLAARTTAEWIEEFDRRDIPAAVCHTLESLMSDPHLEDVGLLQRVETEDEGPIVNINLPNSTSVPAREAYAAPPRVGQHTREILAGLGLGDDEIARLTPKG